MSFEFKVPEFPVALRENTRRAARSIIGTVESALNQLRELKPEVEARFKGTEEMEDRVKESETPEAKKWRAATAEGTTKLKEIEDQYQAEIRAYREKRDAEKKKITDRISGYFAEAVRAEPTGEDFVAPPSDEDWAEIVEEVQTLNATLRNAQANAKRQLGVEFDLSLPVLRNTAAGGERDTGQYGDWRPRFSSVVKDGAEQWVKDDEGNNVAPILSQIVAKLSGVTRDKFVGSMLVALNGDREKWDSAEPGFELSFEVTSDATDGKDGKTTSFIVTKAEPIVRAKSD